MTIRDYFYYVFHPSAIQDLIDEGDDLAALALLHDSLRRQAETALDQERQRP